ncbi:MAG: hypothetical protein H7Y11_06915 [Armatimonadetes bacterium]|nr:hypothetical protein [Anaerolineae bacterium]
MPFRRMLPLFGVLLMLSIAVSLINAQQLVPLPQPGARLNTNMLTNGGFETNTDPYNLPNGWTANNTSAPASDKIKCDKAGKPVAHTGTCAFQFKGNADASKSSMAQTITDTSAIVNGEMLTFSAYIDPRSATPGTTVGKAQLKFSDGSKQKFALSIPEGSDYTFVSDTQPVSIPAGASINNATVKFEYKLTSGKYLVDNASFTLGIVVPAPTKLLANDGSEDAYFGNAVAYSDTGDTLLIGANGDETDRGAAYIFVRSGNAWVQQAKLTVSDGVASDLFGKSVALSADGNTALVGANGDDIGENRNQGSAYVFTRSGTTWTQQAQLTAIDGEEDYYFGRSVAVSADGDTALVGTLYDDDVNNDIRQGSAYVFTRSGTAWTHQAELTSRDGEPGDGFGFSVALNADGNTALLGAMYDDINGTVNLGAAYVFVRSGSTWTQQSQLTAGDVVAGDDFGSSVVLSANGDTALVAADDDTIGANSDQGSAYIFTRNGSTWTQQAQLTASDGATEDSFGSSLALTANGDTALVGAFLDDVGENRNQGSAYMFSRSGTAWTQRAHLTIRDSTSDDNITAVDDLVGYSVALSDDGKFALVGAIGDSIGTNFRQGSAYIAALP